MKQLCRRSRGGSYATQHDPDRVLDLIADQLQELGYRYMIAAGLKPKHVECQIERWQSEECLWARSNRTAELRGNLIPAG